MAKKNWATNITFHDQATLHPKSIEELRDIVTNNPHVRVRGSGHCFNTIADTREIAIVLDQMPNELAIDPSSQSARVGAGLNYAQISECLHGQGLALHNLASLPHISVAGAVATGSHGSGIKNGPLHTAIRSVELMGPDGTVRTLHRDHDDDFYAAIVGLGLTGIAISYVLDIQPTFEIKQVVYGELPRSTFGQNIIEILSSAYSVSYFTTWGSDGVGDLWFKSRTEPPSEFFGAKARSEKAHPIFGVDPDACTEQFAVAGPWHLRLPHFRIDAVPSAGNELQSEFFVDSRDAAAGFAAIEKIAHNFGEKLLVTEVRSMAEDKFWMSQAYGRETVSFHFTWKNDYEVPYLVSLIEEALAPYNFRVHIGKVFNVESDHFHATYPKFADFVAYVKRVDPNGKFQNQFTKELLGLERAR
jgi:xylitol oxidase